MTETAMDHFALIFISGVVVGLAAAVLVSRLAGGFRWISGLFGRDPLMKKLREAEKNARDASGEVDKLKTRLNEKDELIKKAMSSLSIEAAKKRDQ